jgi:hypothetical protein
MSEKRDPAVQEMLDKQIIAEMQSRYMYALDWFDAEQYASVFTEDGVLEWPEGHAVGRKAIHDACVRIGEFFTKASAGAPNLKQFRLRHFVTNRVFDIKGDRARAWAYWMDLNNDNLQRWPYVAGYGYYEDDLIRTADGWRFTKRRIFNEISSESPKENPVRNTL